MNRKTFLIFLMLGVTLAFAPLKLYAQMLPPCAERQSNLDQPWVDGRLFCLELVIHDPSVGTLGFSALTVSDDGTLFAARPLVGEIYAFDDTDGDALPDTPRLYATGLRRPHALEWNQGALFALGDGVIYRITDGEVELVIEDVPSGGGFWGGGLLIDDDGSILVATGAVCARCVHMEAGRGAILRYTVDGLRETLATGLRSPGDLAVYRDALWVGDTALPNGAGFHDGLFRVMPGADYGYPACMLDPLCSSSPAAVPFVEQSEPRGMAAYRGDAIPAFEGALLVVLHGNRGADLVGYQLLAIWLDSTGTPERIYPIVPNGDLNAEAGVRFENDELNLRGSGFYPRRPLDVAVSREGWVYLSVTDGWILALRGP